MRERKIYLRKCLICKERFRPLQNGQLVCDYQCSLLYAGKLRAKAARAKKRIILDKMKTKGQHLGELQKIFNAYIRKRDKGKPCISCGTTKDVQYAAGHYFTVGSYPALRFDEDNVHLQCNRFCNLEKSGNVAEYSINLPLRIGAERFEALKARRSQALHLSIPEIEELKKHYKLRIKELEKEGWNCKIIK